MYLEIYTYDLIPGTREEFIQHVQERLVPLLSHVPGCASLHSGGSRRQPRDLSSAPFTRWLMRKRLHG